jgi:hypothetical protein
MPPDQLAFSFGAPVAPKLGQVDTGQTPLQLRGEIARVWGLPLGERVEITFHPAFPVPAVSGLLELRADPARYPWDPHKPLALRVAGCDFSSRDIERWSLP